ncbi:hypothetical protein Bca52824_067442 [Brassica carinata]|uniref:DUF3444 domain-containing protein n=1 Tax=Brassica carinata TaxID=52824 RepID=A0A8X7QMH6_BRACI|nr:hypothetical protein Bca52824_067442 [Brassica carinata]
MEPESSPPEQDQWDEDLGEEFLSQVTETATGMLDLSLQVNEFREMMEEAVRIQTQELQEREEDSDFKVSLEAELLTLVLEMQTKEVVAQLKEQHKLCEESVAKKRQELKREVQVRTEKLEAREKVLSLLDENVRERSNEMEKREEQFQLKDREVEVKRESLELKEKKVEEIMSELEAREKVLSSLDETFKEKSTELEKREEQFQQTQDSEAKEIEVKMRSLELKEKELEEREELLKGKEKEFAERSIQAENRKRSRNECETSLFAENDRDDNPLIHTGKRYKPIREKETDSDCELYGRTSYDHASASASASEANGREVYEVIYIDDAADEEPEPYNCLDADFNDFNNTMSSFSVGQVWALYDTLDHMPRLYAKIKKVLELKMRVEVTWLEAKQKSPIPIACGEFKNGERTVKSHLTFSHLMVDHTGKKKSIITINPRKGETWALFRDWNRDNWKQQKRPYSYDFVLVLSEFDSVHGIGVAYLERVEGFTSVYELAEQNGVLQMMVRCDEMLRFSHRVPSFELNGDEREGVPPGSFELDPAAIPRDYLEASEVKQEE